GLPRLVEPAFEFVPARRAGVQVGFDGLAFRVAELVGQQAPELLGGHTRTHGGRSLIAGAAACGRRLSSRRIGEAGLARWGALVVFPRHPPPPHGLVVPRHGLAGSFTTASASRSRSCASSSLFHRACSRAARKRASAARACSVWPSPWCASAW